MKTKQIKARRLRQTYEKDEIDFVLPRKYRILRVDTIKTVVR